MPLIYCIILFAILSYALGIVGIMEFEQETIGDAAFNSAMILSTVGPVYYAKTVKGKAFIAAYAIYSSLVFLILFSLMVSYFVANYFGLSTTA